jgi:transcriptional regulator with XRE-family HTH domain
MTYRFDAGRSIRAAQKLQQVSNVELGKRLGVSRSRVQDYRIAHDMKVSTVVKICEALEIDILDFFKL